MTNRTARLSLTPTGVGSTVEVDGHPIRSARSLRLTTGVDQRTILELELIGQTVTVDGEMLIVVSPEIHADLLALGWSPPNDSGPTAEEPS